MSPPTLVDGGVAEGSRSEDESTATTAAGGDDTTAAESTTTEAADPEEGTEEASGDACDIVSDEVVAEVLGVEVVRREANGDPGGQSFGCIKGDERVADVTQASFVSVSMITGGGVLVDEATGQPGSQAVDGLGDQAVYLPDAGALMIRDGEDSIQVQVVKERVPGTQQDAVTVAEDVLSAD